MCVCCNSHCFPGLCGNTMWAHTVFPLRLWRYNKTITVIGLSKTARNMNYPGHNPRDIPRKTHSMPGNAYSVLSYLILWLWQFYYTFTVLAGTLCELTPCSRKEREHGVIPRTRQEPRIECMTFLLNSVRCENTMMVPLGLMPLGNHHSISTPYLLL